MENQNMSQKNYAQLNIKIYMKKIEVYKYPKNNKTILN